MKIQGKKVQSKADRAQLFLYQQEQAELELRDAGELLEPDQSGKFSRYDLILHPNDFRIPVEINTLEGNSTSSWKTKITVSQRMTELSDRKFPHKQCPTLHL